MNKNLESLRVNHWKSHFPYIQAFFYVGEGYSLGTLLLIVPLYITGVFGVSLTKTGAATAFAGIPWLIKILYGLITDRAPIGKFGRRKPYLFLSAVISIPFWWYFTTLNEYNGTFLIILFLISTCAAFSDTVLDGYVIDITPEDKQQVMQSAAWGGRGLGNILGTLISLSFVDKGNYIITFQLAAIVFVVTTLSALLLPTFDVEIQTKLREGFKKIFALKGTKLILLISVFMGASQFMSTFASLLLESYGFDVKEIRNIKTVYDVGYVLGAVLVGLIHKTGKISSENLLKYIFIINIIWLPLASISQSQIFMSVFFFVLGIITTASIAVISKIAMDFSPIEVSSTMFAIFMSMQNLGSLVISSLTSGFILDKFPPIVVLIFSAMWSLLALMYLFKFIKTT